MTMYNFFKNLFGIRDDNDFNNYGEESFRRHDRRNPNDEYRNGVWSEQEADSYKDDMRRDPSNGHFHHFSVFTDPLEMHRYFEQQMEDMIKSFGGFFGHPEDDSSPFSFGGFGNWADMFGPSIEQPPDHYEAIEPFPDSGNLREHLLKPGYEQSKNYSSDHKTDSDLDGKLNLGSLDSILGSKSQQELVPRQPNQSAPFSSYFYGKSMSTRTIQRPDGSVEYHRTTRDNEGNEETVVTRQVGDKQYSVTTRRTKDGKEEKIEDMVNMDEKDVSKFITEWQQPRTPQEPNQDDPNRYFPFDRFFKR